MQTGGEGERQGLQGGGGKETILFTTLSKGLPPNNFVFQIAFCQPQYFLAHNNAA